MATLKQLVSNINKLRPGFNSSNPPQLKKVAPIPLKEQLVFMAEFEPKTDDKASIYRTVLVFTGLHYEPKRTNTATMQVGVTPTLKLYVTPPSYSNTAVKVSCTCRSYAYDFYYFNSINGAGATPVTLPPEFKHVLPKGIRNPSGTVSLCKHQYHMQEALYNRGVIRI
jgi:hypothetical protein